MKKFSYFFLLLIMIMGFQEKIKAQSCDILYFCVRYDGKEVDCSDRFTTGRITVMAKLAKPITYKNVIIQLDKYNPVDSTFEYYSEFPFDTDPDMTYIYFNDVEFGDKGIYRVFLLDPRKNNITSALVEII
jgi:hypothetical protein